MYKIDKIFDFGILLLFGLQVVLQFCWDLARSWTIDGNWVVPYILCYTFDEAKFLC